MSDISQFLIPKGFRFGAVKAGLKASGRTDFALIVADKPGNAENFRHQSTETNPTATAKSEI